MIVGTSGRGPATIAELLPPALAARLDGLDVLSRKVFAGKLQGERRSKRRGRSVEFDDYREYVPGDDLRHIDWNVFARLDRFFIKVFQEEEDLSLHLVIDASASMLAGAPAKLLCAARIAMALGYIGLVKNNRVMASLISSSDSRPDAPPRTLRQIAPLRGRASTQRLAAFLIDELFGPQEADRAGESDVTPGAVAAQPSRGHASPAEAFAAACRTIAASRAGGKGVMVLLTDLLIPGPGGYREGLKLLSASGVAGGGFDVVVLHVLSPGELDPARERRSAAAGGSGSGGGGGGGADSAGESADAGPSLISGDLRLTDAETGREAEVTITPELLDRYRRTVKAFIADAAAFCTQRGCTHALVPSTTDAGDLALGVLRRRGIVG